MADRGKKHYDADKIVIAGDSAGGSVLASSGYVPAGSWHETAAGVLVMSPWTDLTNSGASYQTNFDRDPQFGGYHRQYVVSTALTSETQIRRIRISPLFGDFAQFPPCMFQVEVEVLLDDTLKVTRNGAPKSMEGCAFKF